MKRRRFLAAVVAGAIGSSSGCSAVSAPDRQAPSTTSGTSAGTPTVAKLARLGNPADICEAEIARDFTIKAIVSPTFGPDWSGYDIEARYRKDRADGSLAGDAVVVGLERPGRARAYPLAVLWHHEVVNDDFGRPLLVSYCSICRSGLVADRRIEGTATRFGVTGQLWKPPDRYISASAAAGRAFGAGRWNATDETSVREGPNLVMYDELTRSFWSQAIGQAICGPMTGTRLSVLPSTVTTWSDWRATHPDTEVLLPPPHSEVDE